MFFKQAEKDARDAQVAAGRLLQFSRELLLRMLHTSDDEEVSMEDLDTLLKIADISDPVVNASTLHTIINCDVIIIRIQATFTLSAFRNQFEFFYLGKVNI